MRWFLVRLAALSYLLAGHFGNASPSIFVERSAVGELKVVSGPDSTGLIILQLECELSTSDRVYASIRMDQERLQEAKDARRITTSQQDYLDFLRDATDTVYCLPDSNVIYLSTHSWGHSFTAAPRFASRIPLRLRDNKRTTYITALVGTFCHSKDSLARAECITFNSYVCEIKPNLLTRPTATPVVLPNGVTIKRVEKLDVQGDSIKLEEIDRMQKGKTFPPKTVPVETVLTSV